VPKSDRACYTLSPPAGENYRESDKMLGIHQRIAELWSASKRRTLTDQEVMEFDQCHAVNAKFCWKMAYLENMSLLASLTNDVDWQHEICRDIEAMELSGKLRRTDG
jgi:hypothetical protein